jgi:curved DNA-binding protein CbpA
MFKKIQEAYEVLGDATKRKNYDLQLAKNANKQQTTAKNNFVPVIEVFSVNPQQVYSGEVITVSWKVFNADKITINLIGEVEAQGETTLRLNNLNANEFAEIKITATNTHINKATEKVTQVANKTYLEIKDRVKEEIKENEKREIKEREIKRDEDKIKENIVIEENPEKYLNEFIAYRNLSILLFLLLCVYSSIGYYESLKGKSILLKFIFFTFLGLITTIILMIRKKKQINKF